MMKDCKNVYSYILESPSTYITADENLEIAENRKALLSDVGTRINTTTTTTQ